MSNISIKKGVSLLGLSSQIILAIIIINSVFDGYDTDLVITCGSDGRHSTASLHYSGNAVDLRISCISAENLPLILLDLRSQLGSNYDVVLEKDHIHIEYQPKFSIN